MCFINTHLYISLHNSKAWSDKTNIYLWINLLIPSIPHYRQLFIFYFSSYLLQRLLFDVQAWTLVMRRDRFVPNFGLIWLRTEQSFFISNFFYFGIFTPSILPLNNVCTVVCLGLVNYLVTFDTCLLCLPSLPCTQKKVNKPQVYKVHVWPVLAAFGCSVCKPSDMIWIILQATKPRLDFVIERKLHFHILLSKMSLARF